LPGSKGFKQADRSDGRRDCQDAVRQQIRLHRDPYQLTGHQHDIHGPDQETEIGDQDGVTQHDQGMKIDAIARQFAPGIRVGIRRDVIARCQWNPLSVAGPGFLVVMPSRQAASPR
jgi:hypothetical protein